MSQLTDYLRRLINDVASADFTDGELQVRLNKYRNFLNETIIPPENQDTELEYISAIIGNDGVSQNRLFFLDNVILESEPGTAIPDGEITSKDEVYGVFIFNVAQDNVYLSCNYYDVYETAADIWEEKVGLADVSGDAKVGDEVIPKDKEYMEFCINKSNYFRRSSVGQVQRI